MSHFKKEWCKIIKWKLWSYTKWIKSINFEIMYIWRDGLKEMNWNCPPPPQKNRMLDPRPYIFIENMIIINETQQMINGIVIKCLYFFMLLLLLLFNSGSIINYIINNAPLFKCTNLAIEKSVCLFVCRYTKIVQNFRRCVKQMLINV